ncbi:glycosyltransferase family 2 protein [Candidatus Saccharibacteria bacterium]|nr:glycosyltransferase family 2 protein [Candidatus Saccharibacteria bacterium]
MPSKSLKLSIVIPVYNEQSHLKACLDRVARQTEKPFEVIIVDNSSTDDTVRIAKGYSFVSVIKEVRQSQVFAQKTGFDAARGDIIGRIDADTHLPPDWTSKLLEYFSKNPDVVGIKGEAMPYDIYMKRTGKFIELFYHTLADLISGKKMLWGANCALRKSAWLKISDKVLQRPDIWEDYDISFPLAAQGKVRSISGIEVGLSFRAVQKPFKQQFQYQFRAVRTFALRTNVLRTIIFAVVWSTEVLIYPLTVLDQYILSPLLLKDRPTSPD